MYNLTSRPAAQNKVTLEENKTTRINMIYSQYTSQNHQARHTRAIRKEKSTENKPFQTLQNPQEALNTQWLHTAHSVLTL